MRLEPTDLAILRELLDWGSGNFPGGSLNVPTARLAGRAGLHRNTFQRRMAKLRAGGVIDGFLYEPQASVLGLVRSGHYFHGGRIEDANHLAELTDAFPSIAIVSRHADACFLHTWHDRTEDVRQDAARLGSFLDATDVWCSYTSTGFPPHPADALELSGLDRRLILALRRGFRRSITDAAAQAGTSRRNAARRTGRLVEAQAGALLPMFRPGNVEGTLFAIYDQERWDTNTAGLLAQAFPDRIMGPQTGGIRPMALVSFSSVQQAMEQRVVAAKTPGLEGLQVNLVRDFHFPTTCDAWLAARVQNAPPPATTV